MNVLDAELVFERLSLNSVDRTNAAFIHGLWEHSRCLRSGYEFYYDSNSRSSNPAPPLQKSMFSLEKRGFEDDSGDSLDDSPGSKAAHKTTQHLQACTCMDVQESQSNWPEMRKTLENQGLAAERTVTELLGVFSVFFTIGWEILPPNDSAAPASNEPLRISLGIATKNGAGGDRVSKVLAEPLVL